MSQDIPRGAWNNLRNSHTKNKYTPFHNFYYKCIYNYIIGVPVHCLKAWPPLLPLSFFHKIHILEWSSADLLALLPVYSWLQVWWGTALLNQWRSRPLDPSSPPKSWLSVRVQSQMHTPCLPHMHTKWSGTGRVVWKTLLYMTTPPSQMHMRTTTHMHV